MGSATEYFRFLNEKPLKLNDTKKSLSHITITEKMMKERSKLKLYKNNG